MDMTKVFPSDYFKGSDVESDPLVLTMGKVKIEQVGRDKDERPVVRFQEDDRGLVLNATNNNFLIEAFGRESDGWFGHQIELYAIQTEFAGKPTVGLRVRLPKKNSATRPAPSNEPPPAEPADYDF